MKIFCRISLIGLFIWGVLAASSHGGETNLETMGRQVVETALARLGVGPETGDLACLTNAGFARYHGKETRIFYDIVAKYTPISLGRGNLLPVHCRPGEPLWFAFVHRKGKESLPMTWVTLENGGVRALPPLEIYVARHQSFEPFGAVMGKMAFSIVTLANGWAGNIPPDLMAGACFHDHFCCGVATGYYTARFITDRLPLAEGEHYTYVGVPAWCQDDYLIYHLNLTPGKHGYHTMTYPWSRPWQTEERKFSDLSGIVIRFNGKTGRGRADLLRFDWSWAGFKQFLGEPDLELDWKNQPWLHVWYNKYLFQGDYAPEKFVSVVKTRVLATRADRDALVRLGANPLEVMLGKDVSW